MSGIEWELNKQSKLYYVTVSLILSLLFSYAIATVQWINANTKCYTVRYPSIYDFDEMFPTFFSYLLLSISFLSIGNYFAYRSQWNQKSVKINLTQIQSYQLNHLIKTHLQSIGINAIPFKEVKVDVDGELIPGEDYLNLPDFKCGITFYRRKNGPATLIVHPQYHSDETKFKIILQHISDALEPVHDLVIKGE